MSSSSSEEEEFQGDDEEEFKGDEESSSEDEPLVNLTKEDEEEDEGPRKKPKINYNEDNGGDSESSSDDEDDVPLSSLIEKKPPKKKPPPPKKKTSSNGNKKKAAPVKRKTPSKSNNSSKKYEWASAALYNSECDKGLLIQRLLCRWWYAYTWPDPSKLPDRPPKHYDSLDGFPGLYIGTSGDVVGQIKDLRDPAYTPSFQNFCKKSCEELRDLLLTALENQKKQLVDGDQQTEKELDRMIKWTTKVNVAKADKEAVKVLKAQGLGV